MIEIRKRLTAFFLSEKTVFIFYVLMALLITFRQFALGVNHIDVGDYTFYNNYLIFKNSFIHLVNGQDMYILHPDVQFDLFKYSPTFAVFMAPFAYLPDALGLALWNLINVMSLYFALKYFPFKDQKHHVLALWFIFQELITATMNSQSNALIAALIVFAFICLENNKPSIAALLLIAGCFIKIFVIVGFVLFFFYKSRWKFLLYSFLWGIIGLALPLLFVSFGQYIFLYKSWFSMLSEDHSNSFGVSVIGLMHKIFHLIQFKNELVLLGVLLFCIPLFKISSYRFVQFRAFFTASVLLWVVLFNHKGESPTYIIAITGVVIWYFMSDRNIINTGFLFLALLLTQFSSSDLFPGEIRNYIKSYELKALPCALIWLALLFDMLKKSPDPSYEGSLNL